jgi:nucleotide-binding universal stress UspA family protein
VTLVVPFDGTALSKAALARAVQFETVLEEGVLAVTAIPKDNARYARDRGWLDDGESFDAEAIVSHLREAVASVAPDAEFHHLFVDRYAQPGTIATRIRKFAKSHDASIVFIGSENAGRLVSAITAGQSLAGDRAYDTLIVSGERLPKIERLEENLPAEELLEERRDE